jgi:hypothetical protein
MRSENTVLTPYKDYEMVEKVCSLASICSHKPIVDDNELNFYAERVKTR